MLVKWVPGITKSEGTYTDPKDKYGDPKRGRIWNFPSLSDCRDAFDKESGESWDWEEQEAWIANQGDAF